MTDWKPKLKNYPHFDAPISAQQALDLVSDPKRVATHKFFPFMRVTQRWTKFAKKGQDGVPKERPIRYAARSDAYIYSYYRALLLPYYERELRRLGLDSAIIAYRKVPIEGKLGGKCNIHHVFDAVSKIRECGNCCVLALDISSFFESLDHDILKSIWCRLLGVKKLPADHFSVFSNITGYSFVEKEEAYERLGHFGVKRTTIYGEKVKGYLTPSKEVPRQLCRANEFRSKIAGGDGRPSVIRRRLENYGIPQGSPISDLLANMYLIDFDSALLAVAKEHNGTYLRYSDDILLIVQTDATHAKKLEEIVRNKIGQYGPKLRIKESKSAVYEFCKSGSVQTFRRLYGKQGKNGMEYLGFRFDGKKVYIRDGSLSNLWRKITFGARREAIRAAKRYGDKDSDKIMELINTEEFISRYGRVRNFEDKCHDVTNWTFLTYGNRAIKILGPLGSPIARQLQGHRASIRSRLEREVKAAVARRATRRAASKSVALASGHAGPPVPTSP